MWRQGHLKLRANLPCKNIFLPVSKENIVISDEKLMLTLCRQNLYIHLQMVKSSLGNHSPCLWQKKILCVNKMSSTKYFKSIFAPGHWTPMSACKSTVHVAKVRIYNRKPETHITSTITSDPTKKSIKINDPNWKDKRRTTYTVFHVWVFQGRG